MADDDRSKLICRRLERILSNRIPSLDISVYRGGYVKVSDVITEQNTPMIKKLNKTDAELMAILQADTESRFEAHCSAPNCPYVKVKANQTFDVNDAKFSELPACPQ